MFQYIKIKNVVIISALIVFIVGSTSFDLNNKAYSAPIDLPKVSLNHNGGISDMAPTISVKDKIMNKIGEPEDEGASEYKSLIYAVNKGDSVSFDFENEPAQVDAFLIDYETDYSMLWALEKTPTGEYIANVPSPGLYNLDVHAIYPDGEYVSYSKLLNVVDNDQNLLSLTPQNNPCGNEITLDKLTASGNPATSILNQVINQPLIKELSFGIIDELNVQLNNVKNICGIQLGLKNAQNDINFFAVQSSSDGSQYSDPIVFANTGFSGELPEIYIYPSTVEAKFLKIVPLGSTLEKGLGITDFKLFGQ
ncbi:MAG: hypothetical protein M3Q77_07970 [Thermoproteota archaeon]|nr:hypothetical protein [Thermoleophilaceae bacterium]MDQ3084732.1 hypothetical protein [Thermoproteota archaeon]